MLALRLVRIIEAHSHQIAEGLLERFQYSDKCSDLRKVPASELEERVHEICNNLSDWLTKATEKEVEQRYIALGRRRHAQGVRLSHYIWAIILTKEYLEAFLEREGFTDSAVDLYGHVTLYRALDRFFERTLVYAARGYEEAEQVERRHHHAAA